MEGFLGASYLWVKSAHVIFVIFWIAGLFMLPRFYIYQSQSPAGSAEDTAWFGRERRLRNIILTPAIILTWLFGLMLAADQGLWSQGWFHAKLTCVIALSGFHGWAVAYGRKMSSGHRPANDTTLRIMNEIPGIAVAVIVILVIVRPF
ncbi:MAG: CopD family protein [Brevundimonas sp.]|nr:CopD family protein [Brevundimonas sp.]